MPKSFRLTPVLGLVALLAGATACGTSSSSSSGGGSSGGGGGDLSSCTGQVTVASDLPTSGGDASIGGGTEKGVKLAVTQANEKKLLGGCTVNYVAKDDASVALGKHDPDQGKRNLDELANNPAVLGVVGPFNSGVAVKEMPVSSAAGLTQISPSNTDPGLTIPGSDPDVATDTLHKNPDGKNTYFRVISNDVVQAQVMATYAIKTLNLKSFYDISDNETYGKDLSNYFDQDVKQLGGTIVKRDDTSEYSVEKFKSLATGVANLKPDAVFYGGVASNGSGVLWSALQDVGLKATFLSGDGTVDPQFFKDTGPPASNAEKTFSSSAPDTLKLGSAKQFVTDFKAKYSQDVVAYSTFGYDCMQILLQGIKKVLQNNGGKIPGDPKALRAQVVDAVQATNYDGTIGHTQFDQRGDTLNHSFSIYVPKDGAWVSKGEPVSG